MRKWFTIFTLFVAALVVIHSRSLYAEQTGQPYVGHTDSTKMMSIKGVHGGAGSMKFMGLLDGKLCETNLLYIHTGYIPPKSGIGEHRHDSIEEMFFAFGAPAEWTNQRTSVPDEDEVSELEEVAAADEENKAWVYGKKVYKRLEMTDSLRDRLYEDNGRDLKLYTIAVRLRARKLRKLYKAAARRRG